MQNLNSLLNNIHRYCTGSGFLGYFHGFANQNSAWASSYATTFWRSYTPQEGLVELQGNIMFYLIIILLGVGWILTSVIRNYASSRSPISHKYLNHGTLIELV
jgi:hypothetical protein